MQSPQTSDDGSEIGFADSVQRAQRNGASADSAADAQRRVDRDALRRDIEAHLESIGLNGSRPDNPLTKDAIRNIHRLHREAARERIHKALNGKMDSLLEEIANGDEVDPARIEPELIEARAGKPTGNLFRFATLLWSIPVSQGYGRRLRYLVKDRANGKLIGLFALGDPVFNLRVRDEWIGWDQALRREKLVNVMDAYVVGAAPPYAAILGGKLVASLIASKRVADDFERRYGNRKGEISGKRKAARLALVTVTSALGRSSIYNRLKLRLDGDAPIVELQRLGMTKGYGHFQIGGDLFIRLRQALREDGHQYADGHQFGDGPNWRIRVAREGLKAVGLDHSAILKHGIEREVYAMPIANNTQEFLSGRDAEPEFDHSTVGEIAALARERWVVPRSGRMPEYRQFRREQLTHIY